MVRSPRRFIVVLLGLLAVSGLAYGGTVWEMQLPDSSSDPVTIAVGASVTFSNIPAINPTGKRVTLSFLMRGEGIPPGRKHCIRIRVNGVEVGSGLDRSMIRLLNKPLWHPGEKDSSTGIFYEWRRYYRPSQGWILMSSYNYLANPSFPHLVDSEWPNSVLAIEDLVNSGGLNEIQITNEHPTKSAILSSIFIKLTDEDGFGDMTPLSPFPDRPPARTPDQVRVMPDVSVDANGGLIIQMDNQTYRIDSLFSFPGGGYNIIGSGAPPEPSEPGFSVAVTQLDSNNWQIIGEGQYHRITRTVSICCNKVRVTETIKNKTASVLGVIIKHYLKFDGKRIANALVGGNPDPSLTNLTTNANPTLYMPLDQGGLAFVINDDFFRQYGEFFYDRDLEGTGIKTNNLVLSANNSYSMEWSVYVVPDQRGYGNYFDFVNILREHWHGNFRANGPYIFEGPDRILDLTDQYLANVAAGSDLYAIVLTSSFEYTPGNYPSWFGDFYLYDDTDPVSRAYTDNMTAALAKIRRSAPWVKVLHKFHCDINVLGPNSQFNDSMVRDQNDNLVYYSSYGAICYPTMTNSYGAALFETIRKIFEDYGYDGLFWDEFKGSGAGGNMLVPETTFDQYDGLTGVVDSATKEVLITTARIFTLSASWRKEALDRVRNYGGVVLMNGPPGHPDYSAMRYARMVESHGRAERSYETNLYSPLCYTGSSTITIAQTRERLDMGGIPLRVPRGNGIGFMANMFPITPIEIHKGWILAQECLVTARDGSFGWDESVTGTLYGYDASRNLVEMNPVTVPPDSVGGLSITVPANGLVVLVRDDATTTAEPTNCQEVWQQGYGMLADVQHDCYINWGDFAIFASNWLDQSCDVVADFTGNCKVDWGDFAIFADSWLDCNDPENMPPCVPNW